MKTREFIDNCTLLLGSDRVVRCNTLFDVSGLHQDVIAILYPSTITHVQEIVRMANICAVPLYPVSQGKNWGMGSQLPVTGGCTVVNLSMMDHIIEINEQYGYAEIEAGVTQGKLCSELEKRKSSLFLDVTGSGRETSIVGCALDRGVAYNSLRVEVLINLKVVLGTGEILDTGFGHFPKSVAKNLFKYGIGPDLSGLFAQGGFGIVVVATIKLQYKPEASCAFVVSIPDESGFSPLIDILYHLRSSGVIQCVAHIANRNRTVLTMAPLMFQFAMGKFGNATRQLIDGMIEKEQLGEWSVVGNIMGTPNQVRDSKRRIKKAIGSTGKVTFLSDAKIAFGKKVLDLLSFSAFFARKRAFLSAVEPLYGMTKGVPTDAALNSIAWPFSDNTILGDPDKGDFGLVYCLPIIPASGLTACSAVGIIGEVFAKYGFKPFITLNLMGSALETVVTLAFNKKVKGEIDNAHRCNRELHQVLMSEGFIPYRLGINLMDQVVNPDDIYWQTVRAIKDTLDPNEIIAPGRYCLKKGGK